MIKKILIAGYIILATSLTVHAADKWSGPASPIDPMWGLKGSSLMAEALRDNNTCITIPNSQPTQSDLQDAYDRGKADAQSDSFDLRIKPLR